MLKIFNQTPIVMPEFYKDIYKVYTKNFSFFPVLLMGYNGEKYFNYGFLWLEFYYTLKVYGFLEAINSIEINTLFRIDEETLVLLKLKE